MTFSQRERFIYHAITLMTMSNLGKLAKDGLSKKIHAIRNNRCKNLTDEQIEEILLDVEQEVEACMGDWERWLKEAKDWRSKQEKKWENQTRDLEKFHKLKKPGCKKREFSETIQEEWK